MTIFTTTDAVNRTTLYVVRGAIYSANDFDRVKYIDPITEVASDAGIAAPSTVCPTPTLGAGGSLTQGAHLFRYRWRNSRTGYVSNPSPAVSLSVNTVNQVATITFTSSHVSADSRVDELVVEMTGVSSGDYYLAGVRANSAGTLLISMADTTLFLQQSIAETWGGPGDVDSFGHNQPPLAAFGFEHNGIHFVGGAISRRVELTFTNGNASVAGVNLSALWANRSIQADGDTAVYRVSSATTTTLTLATAYAGTTGVKTTTLFSNFPNRVYWSLNGSAESFDSLTRARDTLRTKGDALTSGVSHGGRAFFFGLASAEYWAFTTDPADAQVVPIPGNRGNFNPRTLVGVDGVLFAWDRQGMYAVTGGVPERISDDMVAFLDSEADYAQSAKFHAGFDPIDRQIMFFYVKKGDTAPKYAAAYDVDGKRWTVNAWRQGITACCQAVTSAGDARLMLGDEYGKVWYYGMEGWRDGFAGSGAVTVGTGASATVIPITTPVDDAAFTWAGVMLTDPQTNESRPILNATGGSTITLATALSRSPAAGDVLYLGSAPMEYETKWWTGSGQDKKRRAAYLLLAMHPSADDGELRVQFYADFGTTPLPYTRSQTYQWPKGVSATAGSTVATVRLSGGTPADGLVRVPIPGGWVRAIKAVVSWSKPVGKPQLLDLTFEADERAAGNAS